MILFAEGVRIKTFLKLIENSRVLEIMQLTKDEGHNLNKWNITNNNFFKGGKR